MDTYDMLITKYDKPQTAETVCSLLKRAGMKNICLRNTEDLSFTAEKP